MMPQSSAAANGHDGYGSPVQRSIFRGSHDATTRLNPAQMMQRGHTAAGMRQVGSPVPFGAAPIAQPNVGVLPTMMGRPGQQRTLSPAHSPPQPFRSQTAGSGYGRPGQYQPQGAAQPIYVGGAGGGAAGGRGPLMAPGAHPNPIGRPHLHTPIRAPSLQIPLGR